MTFSGRSVLVTGGMGFIGSHLVERLVRDGAKVKVLGRYNSRGNLGWLEESPIRDDCEPVLGDVRDPECVRQCVRGSEFVFHLAALIGIPYSYLAPASYVETNIKGTLNVLLAAKESGVHRVVHTSTSEVYGSALRVPIDEEHPLQGQSPYSATKIGADKLAESFYRSFGVPVITARPFNTFGPRQSMRAVIPTIMAQALARKPIKLGSLTPTRDFNFVSNTVDGFLAAASCPDEALGKAYNFGFGEEISIGDLARLICELLDWDGGVELEAQRQRPEKSEVNRLLADRTLSQKALGWTPTVGLKEGLRLTIDWLRDRSDYKADVYAV